MNKKMGKSFFHEFMKSFILNLVLWARMNDNIVEHEKGNNKYAK
mgnify:CR=1 FL=1